MGIVHNLGAVTADLSAMSGADPPSALFISLTLPAPPSVNKLWRITKGRRVRSHVYDDWLGHAGWQLKQQRPGRLRGHVVAVISVERGSLTADIDNIAKSLFDLLVTHQVIEDDRFIVGFCAAWAPPSSKLARVLLLPAGDLALRFNLSADGASGGFFLAPPPEEEPS